MEGLCSTGEQELAQFFCVCKHPLPLFCEEHLSEHQSKPGFHFILPIKDIIYIPSMDVWIQAREWLNCLSFRFETLRAKVETLTQNEEKIDAVYGELQQHAYETRTRLKELFAAAKYNLQVATENAIKDVRDHALDTQFAPVDQFSWLLWFYDTKFIAAHQLYFFQANYAKESLDSVFQVALQFTVPGFESLNIGKLTQSPSERIEELMKTLALRDETHNHEVEELRRALVDARSYSAEAAKKNQQLESVIQELNRQLQIAQEQLQYYSNDAAGNELDCTALQKENLNLQIQVTTMTDELSQQAVTLTRTQKELEAKNGELLTLRKDKDQRISALEKDLHSARNQVKDKEDKLAAANNKIVTLERNYAAMGRDKDQRISALEKDSRGSNSAIRSQGHAKGEKLAATVNDFAARKPLRAPMGKQVKQPDEALRHNLYLAQVPPGPLEKLIAVLSDHVQSFDVATSQWQQLYALRRKIGVDRGTSSTFIAPTAIIACGGYSSSTLHVDRAYMLQGDGSIQELPHMSASRAAPGVTWDSDTKALYVFGGEDGTGTRLRTSEMFLSNEWSSMSDMHQGRSQFNPCWHCSLVYLCGGLFTKSVETYDPRSDAFTLQDFTLPETDCSTTAVEEYGVLTVISEHFISKLQQGRLANQQHEDYSPWSNCTPVVSEGTVYIVDLLLDNGCRCINLTTGALRNTVRLIS